MEEPAPLKVTVCTLGQCFICLNPSTLSIPVKGSQLLETTNNKNSNYSLSPLEFVCKEQQVNIRQIFDQTWQRFVKRIRKDVEKPPPLDNINFVLELCESCQDEFVKYQSLIIRKRVVVVVEQDEQGQEDYMDAITKRLDLNPEDGDEFVNLGDLMYEGGICYVIMYECLKNIRKRLCGIRVATLSKISREGAESVHSDDDDDDDDDKTSPEDSSPKTGGGTPSHPSSEDVSSDDDITIINEISVENSTARKDLITTRFDWCDAAAAGEMGEAVFQKTLCIRIPKLSSSKVPDDDGQTSSDEQEEGHHHESSLVGSKGGGDDKEDASDSPNNEENKRSSSSKKRPATTSTPTDSPNVSEEESDVEQKTPLYKCLELGSILCRCQKAYKGETMILCSFEECPHGWYHPECVGIYGIPIEQLPSPGNFLCNLKECVRARNRVKKDDGSGIKKKKTE